MKSRGDLNTEQQNDRSFNIDEMSIRDVLTTINEEDRIISSAIEQVIPKIEKTVELAVESLRSGGRIFYVGAGTSGRLGVLDASEMPPTFSAPKHWFIGIIAGGDQALRNSIEGAEDKPDNAIRDLDQYSITDRDFVLGISCSGAAAYVVSTLDYAIKKGAKTVYLVTNPNPFKRAESDVVIKVDTGPEIITGSTRMKAGSATKMVLNMISTATMVKLGKVYGNLMVDLMAVNEKLVDRGTRIVSQLTGLDLEQAEQRLFEAEKSVKCAIVMEKLNCTLKEAHTTLEQAQGSLRKAID